MSLLCSLCGSSRSPPSWLRCQRFLSLEYIFAFVESTQENVTGTVKLKLYKGTMMVAGVDTPYALYDEGISSFGASAQYDQKDAAGFINLFGLPTKISAMVKMKK